MENAPRGGGGGGDGTPGAKITNKWIKAGGTRRHLQLKAPFDLIHINVSGNAIY